MRVPQSGLRIDSPSWPLLQAQITYWGTTTIAGNALGTTLIDALCSTAGQQPNYAGQVVKILDGGVAGQVRQIAVHDLATGTITVAAPWTNSLGAAQQIAAATRFVILSAVGGGGGPPPAPPSPGVGLWMFGVCDPGMAASLNTLALTNLAGFNNDLFNQEFWIQILHNASAPGTAPEREIRRVLDYVGATGTFTTDTFSVNVEANDLVCVFHESIMAIEILGFGTLTVSNANTPRDGARTEGDDYFNGCLLMATEGVVRFQPRRIVDYDGTVAPGTFTLDPNNPFTAAPGLVDYIIIGDQTEFVPAADGINNRTPSDVIGNKADAATLDDMSALATASLVAELKRVLLRLSTDAFTANIQGAARTELDTILYQLATYIAALGAAYSATVNPGGAAKTNIEQTLEDLGDVLAGATGIVAFPAAAVPANGVSIAEVLRQIYNDVIALAGAGVLHEQADVPFNVNAALVEANIFDLSVANTRYIVRSLRLKCVDPGAETVTVRLYELVNNVQTLVDTFAITTANFATAHSLTDMFGLFQLAGDNLKVAVIATAAGPFAVTGQYCTATAGV